MRTYGTVLVFDPGDEVIAALQKSVADRSIPAVWFQAIGGFERAVIAYWNRQTTQYEDIAVDEQVEVIALSGNATRKKVHGHVVLGRRDGSTIGGHLKSGIVFPTLEMSLTILDRELTRTHDEATGLELIR